MTDSEKFETGEKRAGASARAMALAFVLPMAMAWPFAHKAFHIDDPMFIRVAQQIAEAPLDYFGGEVDKGNVVVPMYEYNQNPPGYSYVLALVGRVLGWGEAPMHGVGALFAGLAGLGVYLLARRLCARPGLVVCMTVLTPAFLVSATTVMTDLPMVALYVWAAYFWIRALDEGKGWAFAAAAITITLATLLKYYAITLVPLLLVYTLVRQRGVGIWMVYLLSPLVPIALFLWAAYAQYGVNLLTLASGTALDPTVRDEGAPFSRDVIALIFVGGCFAPLAFYAPSVMRARVWVSCLLAVAVVSLPMVEGYSPLQLVLGVAQPFDLAMSVHLGVMLAAAVLILIPMLLDLRTRPGAESILLALWILGALLFTVRVNHLINARVLLPILPAAAILIARQMPESDAQGGEKAAWRKLVPISAAALLTIWVAMGDYAVAEGGRASAERAADIAEEEGVNVYYSGLWGFVYYMEERGAAPLSVEPGGYEGGHLPRMKRGEMVAINSEGRERWRVPPKGMEEVSIFSYPLPLLPSTYHPVAEAGFYSHLTGIVPYFIGRRPAEEFGVYRWTGPSYDASQSSAGDVVQ